MLQDIRSNMQGTIAKIVIGLIIIPFALFGIDSLVGGSATVNVAEVNGKEVTMQELQQVIDMQKRRLMSMLGENLDPSLLDDERLREPALNQLVQQKLLLQAAERESIGVSAQAIDQEIVNMPQFQEDGKFSAQLYQNVLRSNGMTMSYFKEMLNNELLLKQLNSGVAASDFVTEKELTEIAKVVGQKRSFRYFVLPFKKVADDIEVADDDIAAHYDENIQEFQTEERAKLEYISVKQQDYAENVQISDDEIKQAYDLEMADFKADEERRAAHILIEVNDDRDKEQARQLAEGLAKRISDGEEFAALAKEFSDDVGSAANGGDLGFTAGGIFPETFEDALFELTLNQVSEPVLTDSGYHLVQLTQINEIDKPTLEERKPVIKQRLQLAQAEIQFVAAVEQLRDLVFNSEGLADPAEELDMTVQTSDWVTRLSGPGELGDRKVLVAAFSDEVLEDGNNSEVLELAADHFIVVRVAEHEPSKARELADVKDTIVEKLTQKQASGKVIEMAQQAVSELQEGKLLEDIARGNDYQWQVQLSVTRNAANVPRELLSAAFDMSVVPDGQMVIKTVPMNNGDAAVVQLEKVEDGSWSDFTPPQQRGITAELRRNAEAKSMQGYVSTIRENAEIKIL